jgi:hypothetical protein
VGVDDFAGRGEVLDSAASQGDSGCAAKPALRRAASEWATDNRRQTALINLRNSERRPGRPICH